jgi:hypothetical protein
MEPGFGGLEHGIPELHLGDVRGVRFSGARRHNVKRGDTKPVLRQVHILPLHLMLWRGRTGARAKDTDLDTSTITLGRASIESF